MLDKTSMEQKTATVPELLETIQDLHETIADLQSQLDYMKKQLFGRKSEKRVLNEVSGQLSIFGEEGEEPSSVESEPASMIDIPAHQRKAKRTKEELFKGLPREKKIYELENPLCPDCGSKMEPVGQVLVRSELVYVPAQARVIDYYAKVYKCPECGNNESHDALRPDAQAVFLKAQVPEPFIPKSYCSRELMTQIVYEKFLKGVPLYRLETDFKHYSLDLERATMSNWLIYTAEKYGKPVFDAMKRDLLKERVIHADETPIQVLHEPERNAATKSKMWLYCAPKSSGKHINLFEYTETRNGDNAVAFLGDYSGYLVCDGYDGYNKLETAKRCGCWVHCKRKWVQALPADKKLRATSRAAKGVEWCEKIFHIEKELEDLTPEERTTKRQERLKPVLDAFYAWLEGFEPNKNTTLAKAYWYTIHEKEYLYRCLEDGEIEIHNNRAENAIRPFVVGRKNWLFCNTPKGAKASEIWYSLITTAYANGLNVREYLNELFNSEKPIMPYPKN